MIIKKRISIILGVAFAFSLNVQASNISKVGMELKALKNSNSMGTLFGWRYMNYEGDNFSIGGAGYTGQLSNGASGSYTYGGLTGGFKFISGVKTEVELCVLAGGGGGFTAAGLNAGGVVLEPSLSISLVLGKSVRSALNAGYVWMPNSTSFSGITIGLRFDFIPTRDVEVVK